MAAQAGWYSAPGETATLRYWDGATWTDHRQPMPQQVAPVTQLAPVAVAAPEQRPDPYASAAGPSSTASTQSQPSHFRTGFGVGGALNIDGMPVGEALTALPELALVGQQLASAAAAARSDARLQPRSTALKGAVKGILAGLVIIVIGVALFLFFSAQGRPGAGEALVQGRVSGHIGVGSSCQPEVNYTVAGHTYTTVGSGTGGSCSSNPTGEPVDVIYSVANPAQTARAEFADPVVSFIWLLPLLGVVIFVSGLGTFVVRLFRRRSPTQTP